MERLTHPVRDARAGYHQTIGVLREAKGVPAGRVDQNQFDAGLGETDAEIERTLVDLRGAAVDILTLGAGIYGRRRTI